MEINKFIQSYQKSGIFEILGVRAEEKKTKTYDRTLHINGQLLTTVMTNKLHQILVILL